MQTIEMELEFIAGTASAEWWTPEVASLLCALCGRCAGWWETDERPLDCLNGNPWCG
jgi:hypothetical protein